MTARQTERAAGGLAALVAVNAFGGAVYGFAGARNVPRRWLEGSPFADYRVPSAVLGLAVPGVELSDVACTSKTMPEFPALWKAMVRPERGGEHH